MDASIAYENVTYGNVTEEERFRVRADLLKYCKLDTDGIHELRSMYSQVIRT